MLTPRQIEKLKSRALLLKKQGDLALLEEIEKLTDGVIALEDKATKGDVGQVGPQGQQGDRGDQGEVGPQGEQGPAGLQGPQGVKGETGQQGASGANGEDGDDGQAGQPGKDGSPDTPEQIVEKINQLGDDAPKIDASHITGLPESRTIQLFGGGGGGRNVTVYDETTVITKLLRALKFVGAGVQATADQNGVVTVTITGSASSESNGETLTDSGNHTTFTFAHSPTTGGVRNVWRKESGQLLTPTADYTISGSTLTATSAQVDGNGIPFTLIANYTY